ncbi:HTH-type transcriptional regulator frlR [Fibrisoma limi BUZ 3]|uniref:HTH-type transcriptional regulator frlR n=1 Tax=Fibrisoma limi BUZ 3 TaxID=1185876 RepID=I2GHM2_9BACT|nr:GntR family transcriptional regulator [Fibrisoma limi]CCH53397.1 HTH-type transcriptional regulator frlR [Fibrisoma limi BUZ 3]
MTRQRYYQQIHDALKQQIQQGVYPTGSLLPSENELCAAFQTTRMTVRQALNELVRDGFIERRHGKGSLVTSTRPSLGLLSFRGFSDVVGNTSHQVRTTVLDPPVRGNWPAPFFYPLSADEQQAGCIVLNRLRYADDVPVMLEHTYVPALGTESLLTEPFLEGSLFRTLSVRHQIDMRNLEQSLRAVAARPEQATVLGCKRSAPLLYIERRYLTNRPDFYVYSALYCHTEHYAISNSL